MKLQVLNNNMTVMSEANDNVNSVSMALYIRGGIAYEDYKSRGITHLMEHMMFRSLCGAEQRELYEKLRQMGTMMYAATYMECVEFEISILPEHFSDAINILNGILKEQYWTKEEIESEKKVVLRQIDEKGDLSYSETVRAYGYKAPPWNQRIMGTKTTVKQISRKKLLDWQKTVCNPANACLIITGNFSEYDYEHALNLMGSHAVKCEPFNVFAEQPPAIFNRDQNDDKIFSYRSTYSDVSIWFDVNKENKESANLLSCIMTDLGSPISLELRENRAWVTDFDTYVNHDVSFSRFMIEFSVESCYLSGCLEYLFHILGNLDQYLTSSELSAAKSYWKRSTDTLIDRPRDYCLDIAWGQFVTGPDSFYPYQDITLSNFKQAAAAIFSPHNMFTYIECGTKGATIKSIKKILCNFREGKIE